MSDIEKVVHNYSLVMYKCFINFSYLKKNVCDLTKITHFKNHQGRGGSNFIDSCVFVAGPIAVIKWVASYSLMSNF